jgi:hypothetical protein
MSGHAVDEAPQQAEPDRCSGVGVEVEGVLEARSKHTSAALRQVAGIVGLAGDDLLALRPEMCCAASPQPHSPASSSGSCACNAGVPGSLPQRIRVLQKSLCDVNARLW